MSSWKTRFAISSRWTNGVGICLSTWEMVRPALMHALPMQQHTNTGVRHGQPGWLIFIENEQPVKSLWKHCIMERLQRDPRAAVGMRQHRCSFGNEWFAAEEQPGSFVEHALGASQTGKSTVLAACVVAGWGWQVKCFPWSFYNRTFKCCPTMLNWWIDRLCIYLLPVWP